jgi:type I restriction enzyme S subunit
MRQGWTQKTLGETCEIYQPKTITAKDMIENGPYPVFGANGIIGRYNKFNHEEPQLLITCRGATCGAVNISEPFSWITGNAMVVRPKDNSIDFRFLEYVFRGGIDIGKSITGAAQPQITRANLSPLKISYPSSLHEQRRIADLLTRAEGIVRLRREAEKKAAELIPALFLDMFGDPATNPKGWPVRKVADFVSRFEGGKNIQAGSENGSSYRILKVSAATSGVYRESESKPAPDGYNPPLSHIVRAGDMLFSRANTEELVGATAIVGSTDGKTLLPDKLWRFVWAEPVELAYMHALFQSSRVRRELGKLSSGTSASMRNISQGKLFDLVLPVAPYTKQKGFGEHAASVHSIQSQQSEATIKAKTTFDALLAQAFTHTNQG